MPVKAHSTEFGGHTYKINTLPADKGLDAFGMLMGVLEGPLGELAKSIRPKPAANDKDKDQGTFLDTDLAPESLAEVATALMRGLSKREVKDLIMLLLDVMTKDDRPVKFATEFAGNYGALPHLVLFALRINFGSFLAENAGAAALADKLGGIMTQEKQT